MKWHSQYMERHKIPWFRTTNQSLNSHFEWIYPTYHQTSKQLMTFSEGQNGVVPPSFQLHLPSPSCHHQGSSALWYVAAVRVTRYINNIKQHQTFNRGNQTINMTQHYSVFFHWIHWNSSPTHHQFVSSFLTRPLWHLQWPPHRWTKRGHRHSRCRFWRDSCRTSPDVQRFASRNFDVRPRYKVHHPHISHISTILRV